MPGRSRAVSLRALSGIGLELAVAVVLFLFVGYKLDAWRGTEPRYLVVGGLLGIVVGFYNAFRRLRPLLRDSNARPD
jgi:F0F1-type ATP synthase assembly protein I